jgi:membrane protein oxaA
VKKKSKIGFLLVASLLILTACGTSEVTANSSDFWEKLVYFFAEMIQFLSFNGSTGIGIILFTLVIRTVLLPVFQFQTTSSRKMQEVQPQIKKLQEKYPGKDMDSKTALAEETSKLYKEMGVNPYAAFLPLFIQMPVLLALFQALTRVEFLKTGHFLWLNLAATDPTFILPILAALFTFFSTWLSNKALPEKNGGTAVMTYLMPVLIFFFAVYAASGVALYWTVSNAYQVGQTLLLSNPFKIIAEREAKAKAERQLEMKKKRALQKAQKKKK